MGRYPELKQQKVLVTGAASGIGQAQMQAFLAEGAQVVALDQKPIMMSTSNLTTIQVDVGDEPALKQCLLRTLAQVEYFDIVCNTAGILDQYAPTLATTSAEWDRILTVNLKSQFILTNVVLPIMLARQKGVFVNMASIAGLVAGGGGAAYTAAKHAIIGYTKQVDYDYASQGIRANCIAPGAIKTPMNAADFVGAGLMAKSVADQTPAKRWATPEEVADLSLYLASPLADYIHGSVVPIDGGWIER